MCLHDGSNLRFLAITAAVSLQLSILAEPTLSQTATPAPWFQTVDLAIDESREVTLEGHDPITLTLRATGATRDRLRKAVRQAWVEIELDGDSHRLECGNYNLPTEIGPIQVDCPFMSAYRTDFLGDYAPWGLEKDARLRVWAGEEESGRASEFRYPVRQRWFASATQLGNEPVFVDGGDRPLTSYIYYHNGLDIGGSERLTEVAAATSGVVVTLGMQTMASMPDEAPVDRGYDSIHILDSRG